MELTTPPPQVDRFLSSDNQVIALESIVIVVLCVYIIWKEKMWSRKEEVLTQLAEAVSELTGAINAKK